MHTNMRTYIAYTQVYIHTYTHTYNEKGSRKYKNPKSRTPLAETTKMVLENTKIRNLEPRWLKQRKRF